MKKKVLEIISIIAITFFVIMLKKEIIIANEKANVLSTQYIEYQYSRLHHTGILYDNNKLFLWGDDVERATYENVKKFSLPTKENYTALILYTDNTLKRYIYDEEFIYENVKDYIYLDEHVLINDEGFVYVDDINNNLYYVNNFEPDTKKLLLENVNKMLFDEYYESVIVKTNDNKMYSIFNDAFDQSEIVNESPSVYLVEENIKDLTENYFINTNNELYVYGLDEYGPYYVTDNVKSVEVIYAKKFQTYTLRITKQNDEIKILTLETKYDYKTENMVLKIRDLLEETETEELKELIRNIKKTNSSEMFLTYDGKLYTNLGEIILSGVKDIFILENMDEDGTYILKDDGTLNYYCNASYCYNDILMDSLSMYQNSDVESKKLIKILDNIKSVSEVNNYIIEGKNNEIYRFGHGNDNKFNNINYMDYKYHFVQVSELNYNGENISPLKINILANQEARIEQIENIVYKVIPENATYNNIEFTSNNTEIAQIVENQISYIAPGTAEVCGVIDNNSNTNNCVNYVVYDSIKGINILNDNYDVVIDEQNWIYMDFEYTPNNIPASFIDLEVSEYDSEKLSVNIYKNDKQIRVSVFEPGTYDLTFKQKGCDTKECTDTVRINATKKVERIELDLPEENYDGIKNVFIYLEKSNQLQTKYKVYPENATEKGLYWINLNPEIVTIDDNGLITAHKSGKAQIQVFPKDGDTPGTAEVYTSFNVIVYENLNDGKIGDVNKDNNVDILDLIKLRGYLAEIDE